MKALSDTEKIVKGLSLLQKYDKDGYVSTNSFEGGEFGLSSSSVRFNLTKKIDTKIEGKLERLRWSKVRYCNAWEFDLY